MRLALVGLLGTLVLSGCQEDLTAPAACPALCPGGSSQVFEEVLSPILGSDSSFQGYVEPPSAQSLLVSNGLEGFEERAIVRFGRRTNTVTVRDTARSYAIDSVAFGFTILARDTNLTGLQVGLYRVPATIDSTTTFADLDPAFVPANLIRVIDVADTLNAGAVRTVFSGTDLSRVEIPEADSGIMALGIRIESPAATGIRLGSIAGGTGGVFVTYATLDIPDTGSARIRSFQLLSTFNSYLHPPLPPPDPDLLTVGGDPASRALLRFALPPLIQDSALVIRATLELTPVQPIGGLPTDRARLQARGLLTDLGAKSPLTGPIIGPIPTDTLDVNATSVSLEVVRLVQLWLGASSQPQALMVSMAIPSLEGASFTRPIFYSTRALDPAVRPRLRINYMRSFPFENP